MHLRKAVIAVFLAGLVAAPISSFGLDAAQMGVRAGSPDDQSASLQRAIDRAAADRVPLALPPGVYLLKVGKRKFTRVTVK